MITRRALIVLAMLGIFSGSIAADEKYEVVKIWPEAPQGWHFFKPKGVAVDKSGNVYIADSGNYKVKKFDAEGRLITQWGSPGQGDGQFNTIGSVKVDGSGIVYVFDNDWVAAEGRIQKFSAYGHFIGVLTRKTPDADKIKYPIDLAFDSRGNLLVLAVDYRPKLNLTYGVRIEKYSADGAFMSQWGAEAGSGDGQFQRPGAIAVDAEDNIYISEWNNGRVQKFDSSGKFLTKWGALWTGSREGGGIFRGGARSVAIDGAGNVYVLDGNSVQKFTAGGEFLARWETPGDQSRRLAMDSHANVYVTCENSHDVIKLDPKGDVVSRWGCAGTGDSLFSLPGSVVVDSSGNTFVADLWNYRIQKFDSEDRFSSKWGSEIWFGIEGLAADASGNLYVACGEANEVQKYNPDGRLIGRWGSGGSGDGQFQYARAIAVGLSGNVYVADRSNHRVQKFADDGRFLAKWGTKGTGDGQFTDPFFIAVDDSGNVWVGDQLAGGTHRMQKLDGDGKFLAKWTRRIVAPRGMPYIGAVAVDFSGSSYYVFEDRVEKYDCRGDLISSYGREGTGERKLGNVWGMCVDKAGYLYIAGPADPYDSSRMAVVLKAGGWIRRLDANGRLAGTWTAEGAEGLPNGPITVDRVGNVYVSYVGGIPICKLSPDGKPVAKFPIAAPRESGFSELGGIAVDHAGRVYAVDSVDVDWDYGVPSIKKFEPNGELISIWGAPETATDKFRYPVRIAADGSGNIYVTDQSSHCVHKLDVQGKYIKSWGDKGTGDGQFDMPEGIAVDKSGNVYVCDRQNCRIQKFDSNGKFLGKWGKEGSGDGEFHFPAAVALDKKDNVYVADSDNHRIQKFTADGKFVTEWGEFGEAPGQLNVPLGIAVDASGNVYVSDSHNHRIQKFAPVSVR